MQVLVLNCGSTTVKFQVIAGEAAALAGGGGARLAKGLVERIGGESAVTLERPGREPERSAEPVADHEAAVRRVLEWVAANVAPVDAIGHRVVHGGARFAASVLIDDGVAAAIESLEELAPLHNGPSLAGIRACRTVLGRERPMVAVFDTAFHATLPEAAARYAIPDDLARRHGIRRYGFHGTAYRSVVAGYARQTGTPPERVTIVALHLGGGCSAAAIREGRSVETSMGFTPLEGLVMATRSGDLDPAIVAYLARREGVSPDTVEHWLNERAGLFALGGSRDMRDLLAREAADPRARLAVDAFCHRARKYIGAYLATLGGADAVVFSGGIGEHAPAVRARIAAGLEWLGLVLDPARNEAAGGRAARISAGGARLAAWVMPVDEEVVIAADTVRCVAGEGGAGRAG
jgi:acetate kinase